jgi:hypothetical protein
MWCSAKTSARLDSVFSPPDRLPMAFHALRGGRTVKRMPSNGSLESMIKDHAEVIAQILRSEFMPLSSWEVADALGSRIAFGLKDASIIDWNAAMLFDKESDDMRTVLELANAELLEMRFLDKELDEAIDRAYDALARQRRQRIWLTMRAGEALGQIAGMQVDAAVLFERINNTLKLLGDQYLARAYRLASQRFHLHDWDSSISRKLQSLESIYQKMTERASTKRLEVLEWIIIVLIAISICLPMLSPH